MNEKSKTIVPKLRFCQFKDKPEWNVYKLGELSVPIKKRAGSNKYMLMSVTSGIGLVPQIEKFGREIAGNAYKHYYVIKKNDFAYNKSATKLFPEGYISMLTDYEEAALPNSIFTCFRITAKQCDPEFFNQLFQNNYHGAWLRKYIEAGSRAHGALSVNPKHLWNMPVPLPESAEQRRIAGCLAVLDDLIIAEEKKLSVLKDYKKGFMQKLFPAEGTNVPEWRFPEFRNDIDWKSVTLSELANFRRGSFPQPYGLDKWYDEKKGMPFIQVFDVGDNMKVKEDTKNRISELAKKQSVFIPAGTVIVTIQGSIGRVAITQFDAYIDRTLLLFEKFYIDIDKRFIAYSLQLLFEAEKKRAPGGTIKTITKEVLSSFRIALPQINEQQKIADFFCSTEELLSAQTKKIEALKQYKKGLMQGLFPSIEEVSR